MILTQVFVIAISLSQLLLQCQAQDDILNSCEVTERASHELKNCQFPFIFNGTEFHSCTTIADPDAKPWCSTRTTKDGFHIGRAGFWGHCPEQCIKEAISEDLIKDYDQTVGSFRSIVKNEDFNNCPCLNLSQCPLARNLASLASRFPQDHSRRNTITQLLKSVICEPLSSRSFHCCQQSSNGTMEKVSPRIFATNQQSQNRSSGTWIPRTDACGLRTNSGNILGGTIAIPGEFPFMALLGYKVGANRVVYLCGGTLINKLYVLTAAHCIDESSRPLENILLGEHDLGSRQDCLSPGSCAPPPQVRKAAKVIIHQGWNRKKFYEGNDIALIRLDEPVILFYDDKNASNLVPVCLPLLEDDSGHKILEGKSSTVIGWGKVTNDEKKSVMNYAQFQAATRTLNKVDLKIQSRERCVLDFGRFNLRNMICSGGEQGKDSCSGDSGGPLLIRENGSESPWFQAGIVSFGSKKCGVGRASVYTKVSEYLDWISSNLEP